MTADSARARSSRRDPPRRFSGAVGRQPSCAGQGMHAMTTPLTCQADVFSLNGADCWLNSAYMGPLPRPVQQAGVAALARRAFPSTSRRTTSSRPPTGSAGCARSWSTRSRRPWPWRRPWPTAWRSSPATCAPGTARTWSCSASSSRATSIRGATGGGWVSSCAPWRRRRRPARRHGRVPAAPRCGTTRCWRRSTRTRHWSRSSRRTGPMARCSTWCGSVRGHVRSGGLRARRHADRRNHAARRRDRATGRAGRPQLQGHAVQLWPRLHGRRRAVRTGSPVEESWLTRAGSENFARLVDYQDAYAPGARRFDSSIRANPVLIGMLEASCRLLLDWQPARDPRLSAGYRA